MLYKGKAIEVISTKKVFGELIAWIRILEDDTFDLINLQDFTPGKPITIKLTHADGSEDTIQTNHSYNEGQIQWFREGSALNLIKKQNS